jgi:hypothetical protein
MEDQFDYYKLKGYKLYGKSRERIENSLKINTYKLCEERAKSAFYMTLYGEVESESTKSYIKTMSDYNKKLRDYLDEKI